MRSTKPGRLDSTRDWWPKPLGRYSRHRSSAGLWSPLLARAPESAGVDSQRIACIYGELIFPLAAAKILYKPLQAARAPSAHAPWACENRQPALVGVVRPMSETSDGILVRSQSLCRCC